LNFNVLLIFRSSENHNSFESGGRIYGYSGSSPIANTYTQSKTKKKHVHIKYTLALASAPRIAREAEYAAVPAPINKYGTCSGNFSLAKDAGTTGAFLATKQMFRSEQIKK
jgi:hypothetical protein